MNQSRQPSPAANLSTLGLLALAGLLVAGCTTMPPAEKAARARLTEVRRVYPPPLPLPTLAADADAAAFLQVALLNNPNIAAAYYDWVAAVAQIAPARTPPDPRLTLQADIANAVTSLMPGLMFDLLAPGKLAAAGAAATATSDVRYYAFKRQVLQTAFTFKKAYYELLFLDEKLQLNRETLALLTEIEQLAAAQNATGKATLPDVLRAQIEAERVRNEIRNLDDARGLQVERFKAALGFGPHQPTPPVPQRFVLTPPTVTAAQLTVAALAHNPELQAMQAEIRQAEAGIALADKAKLPDFTVGIGVDVKAQPYMVNPQLGATLPIWRQKLRDQLAAAQAAKSAASARLSAAQINVAVEFAEQSYLARESERNLALLRETLLPKTRQALEAGKAAYLTGAMEFAGLLETQRLLIGLQLDAVTAQLQRELALAELSLVILGRPPPGAPVANEPESPGLAPASTERR